MVNEQKFLVTYKSTANVKYIPVQRQGYSSTN